eukprot:Hpha_TRINITY_DN15075_c0_g3::TRINITY_DN15075_c0_g3_i1::g.124188::m.124188
MRATCRATTAWPRDRQQPPPVLPGDAENRFSPRPVIRKVDPSRRRAGAPVGERGTAGGNAARNVRGRGMSAPQRAPRRATSLPRQQQQRRAAPRPSEANEPTPPHAPPPGLQAAAGGGDRLSPRPVARRRSSSAPREQKRSWSAPRPVQRHGGGSSPPWLRPPNPRPFVSPPRQTLGVARQQTSPRRSPYLPSATPVPYLAAAAINGQPLRSPRALPSPLSQPARPGTPAAASGASPRSAQKSGPPAASSQPPQVDLTQAEGVNGMSLEELWVSMRLQEGKLSLKVAAEDGTLHDQPLSDKSAQLILAHWCSPHWVFKSQKQQLVMRRNAAKEAQTIKTLYLEHRARRQPTAGSSHETFADEGVIVDKMHELLTQQNDAIKALAADNLKLREKLGGVRASAEGFRLLYEASEKECKQLTRRLDSITRGRHVLPEEETSDAPLSPKSPRSPRGGGKEVRLQHAECISLDAKFSVVEAVLQHENHGRLTAEQQIRELQGLLREDGVEQPMPSPKYGTTQVSQSLKGARVVLRRVDALLRQREAELARLRSKLQEDQGELARAKGRQSPRAHIETPSGDDFQQRLQQVRRSVESARAAEVYERLSKYAQSLHSTHAEALALIQENSSDLELALSQIEVGSDGVVTRGEWQAWFEALGAIGQAPDKILDGVTERLNVLGAPSIPSKLQQSNAVCVSAEQVPQRFPSHSPMGSPMGSPLPALPYTGLMKELRKIFDDAQKSQQDSPARARTPGSSPRGSPKRSQKVWCDRVVLLSFLKQNPVLHRRVHSRPGLSSRARQTLRDAFNAAAEGLRTVEVQAVHERLDAARRANPGLPDPVAILKGLRPTDTIGWTELDGRAHAYVCSDERGPLGPSNWGEQLVAAILRNAAAASIQWTEVEAIIRETLAIQPAFAPANTPESFPGASPAGRGSPHHGSVSPPTDEEEFF